MEKTASGGRLPSICFLTAVTVAMIGWLTAFGWVAVALANWVSP
jgi:hypothetical protein